MGEIPFQNPSSVLGLFHLKNKGGRVGKKIKIRGRGRGAFLNGIALIHIVEKPDSVLGFGF